MDTIILDFISDRVIYFGSYTDTKLHIFMLGVFIVYVLPTLVASRRKHINSIPICILNLLLGWTFIGWVVALCWSFTSHVDNTTEIKELLCELKQVNQHKNIV